MGIHFKYILNEVDSKVKLTFAKFTSYHSSDSLPTLASCCSLSVQKVLFYLESSKNFSPHFPSIEVKAVDQFMLRYQIPLNCFLEIFFLLA